MSKEDIFEKIREFISETVGQFKEQGVEVEVEPIHFSIPSLEGVPLSLIKEKLDKPVEIFAYLNRLVGTSLCHKYQPYVICEGIIGFGVFLGLAAEIPLSALLSTMTLYVKIFEKYPELFSFMVNELFEAVSSNKDLNFNSVN